MLLLAVNGSLRRESSNAALLRALAALAPPEVRVVVHEGLAELPPFNPDDDGEGAVPPPAVARWRAALAAAAGVIVSSPEYAHGVPGVLKNALDWVVSSGELVDRPVVLLNAAAAGGDFAQASLRETLTVMSARVLVDASQFAAFVPRRLRRAEDALAEPEVVERLRASLAALVGAAA